MFRIATTLIGGILLSGVHRSYGLSRGSSIFAFRKYHIKSLGMRAKVGYEGERGMVPSYIPKTENQKRFVDALDNVENKLIVVLGPAGTGKTLFACLKAIKDLKAGIISRIVITRPVVTVEEDIGFLPGNVRNKMDPWMRPIFDIFLEFYSQRDLDSMIQSGVIEISPLAFMRGRTFKRCFILADEMQNSSPNQMLMLMTRIGDGSRMVVDGDLKQSDRDYVGGGGSVNGLADFVSRYRKFTSTDGDVSGISLCHLDGGDVQRSPIVVKLLDIYSDSVDNMKTMENDAAIIPNKDFYSRNKPLW